MSEIVNSTGYRPIHVPDEAVYDFDIYFDPGLLKDPHERLREVLREAPPVFWTPRNNGHWFAVSHDAVLAVARDWERFSSEFMGPEDEAAVRATLPPNFPHIPSLLPLTVDPPDHVKFRAPLALTFGPKAIKARTDEIRLLAAELIAAIADRGSCDFLIEVAERLPVFVFLKMMGLSPERYTEFRALVHKVLSHGVFDPTERAIRFRSIADTIGDVIQQRREDPQDDLISLLWAAEIDGKPMTIEIMEDFCVMLFMAGLDTVINAIGFGVRHLAVDSELQARLRADPSLIPEAAEELLRRYNFVTPERRVRNDIEFFGRNLKGGDRIMFSLPTSGLDPSHYNSPEVVDLERESKAHLAFGAGPHRCVGSHLARLELQLLYEELLRGLPPFRLDPDRHPIIRPGSPISVISLPLRWD